MITSIKLCDVATFKGSCSIDDLKRVNFFYGGNGTGKTTISKVIDDPDRHEQCDVIWENGNKLETLVYNRDFIDKNFSQGDVRGIFTIGEDSIDVRKQIDELKNKIGPLNRKINDARNTLNGDNGKGGKIREKEIIEKNMEDRCWKVKTKYDKKFSEAMKGYRGDKRKFKEKVLDEKSRNKSELLSYETLEKNASMIFLQKPVYENPLPAINFEVFERFEKDPILQKRVIGKEDVDIAAMIQKLNNSDWVRQGFEFYKENKGICPFCQQQTTENFHKSLSEYFDDSFQKDTNTIVQLQANYTTEAQKVQREMDALLQIRSRFLDDDALDRLAELKVSFDQRIETNMRLLGDKQKESSKPIVLQSITDITEPINTLLTEINKDIEENNRIADNVKNEKKQLTSEIWKFIVSELNDEISRYHDEISNNKKATEGLGKTIEENEKEKMECEKKIKALESITTSVDPTQVNINNILKLHGFNSFRIGLGDEPHTYKMIREDGSDAAETLSEGERNFVMFLYFYYLIKGSQSNTGVDEDKVVVIDDPISSLDNDVLFLVSALIKELLNDVRKENESRCCVKQMFILTHNIYFHKEVTYNSKRQDCALKDESFWLVRKKEKVSEVKRRENNPIKTSYDLLWDEVRNEERNIATIQNVLRRILENYFKLIGNQSFDNIASQFEGPDKACYRALISWIHDGSHSAFNEDHYTALDQEGVENYLRVFKEIFEKTGHISHYNMMMEINST